VFRADIGDGTVYVYRIEPDEYHSGDADFTDFYIATYETGDHLGEIWGWGETPKEALKNAESKWGEEEIAKMRENPTRGYFNPFLKAFKTLKEAIKENIKETLEPALDYAKITEEDLEDILFEDLEDYEYLTGKTVGILDVRGEFRANVEDGIVTVYRISDSNKYNNKLPFSANFYIATLYSSNGAGGMEKTWGLGETPEEALENAERKWDDLTGGYANPFTKALEMLKEEDNEEGNNILQNMG
jgi:predicted RNase H-like HicB family nuclease